MATHSSVLAWRIPGMGEPGGFPSMGSHRVGHDCSDLAAAAVYQYHLPLHHPQHCFHSLGQHHHTLGFPHHLPQNLPASKSDPQNNPRSRLHKHLECSLLRLKPSSSSPCSWDWVPIPKSIYQKTPSTALGTSHTLYRCLSHPCPSHWTLCCSHTDHSILCPP